jgi:hypothetical protein
MRMRNGFMSYFTVACLLIAAFAAARILIDIFSQGR